MADRSVRVRLEAVINPYVTKMAEAEAATRKLSQAEKDLRKATVDLGASMQRVGAAMTIGVTAPLLLFAKNAAQTAMTAQETANRVTVAFGAQEEALHEWSEGSARAMGLARHEAEGTAATFSNMFTEMGLGAGDAFKMATGMVKLSADVGSFRDVDPSEMLVRMRAAVVGEYEPLRNMGIVLTDVAVRNEAVKLGLAQTREQATAAALVQARYSLILQQTSKDQGDYARTADSATNSIRTASAAYKDASAELGGHMLPAIAEGAQLLTALAEGFTKLGPAGQIALLTFGGLTAVAGPAVLVTGTLIRNLQTIATVAPMAANGLRVMTAAAGGIGIALTAAATAYALFADHQDRAATSVDRMGEAFDTFARGEAAAARQIILEALATNELLEKLNELGVTQAAVTDIMTTAQDGRGKNVEATKAWNAALDESVRTGKMSREEADELSRAVFLLSNEYANAAGGASDVEAANRGMGSASAGAAGDVGALKKQLDELYDAEFSASEAADRFADELFNFSDGVRAAQINGDRFASSLDASSDTGRRNRESLRGLVGALFDYSSSTGASAATTAAMRAQLVETLTQLGFNRTEAEKFTSVLSQLGTTTVTPKVGLDASGFHSEADRVDRRFSMWGSRSAWNRRSGGGASSPLPSVATALTGEGPEAQQAREQQQRDREESTRKYLDALRDAEEERKRLEEAATSYLKAVYDEQVEIEDNQYRMGVISKDRYLELLKERLSGTKEFTNEWVALWEKINDVQLDQLAAIRAYEEGRQYGLNYSLLAGQRAISEMRMTPALMGGASTTIYNTKTFSPVLNAYGSDAMAATSTNNQKLRDLAASYV